MNNFLPETRNEENKQPFALIMSNCDLAGDFSRYSVPIHWLGHGHMTSNNETVSRQMP